jgi:bacterioferritin-associated ferredoxin
MIVCICKRISDRSIIELVQQGSRFEDIRTRLGVATQCGSCKHQVLELVKDNERGSFQLSSM